MKIVLTGATGNVGTGVLDAFAGGADPPEIVVGVARRPPDAPSEHPFVRWHRADITRDDLGPAFRGADVVIHLAWALQPQRDEARMQTVNIAGTERVLAAALAAGVGAVVCASSVGAYSPSRKDVRRDETWPTDGVATSSYSRHKAYVERLLDVFEATHPEIRVVRIRPGLIFQAGAASEIGRFFLGPLIPRRWLDPRFLPVVPAVVGLAFQAVHAADVGHAYRRAALGQVRGAFNLAAEPVLDPHVLARALGAKPVPVRAGLLRHAAGLSWHARLQPTSPGWIDLALQVPIMDITRARTELGWEALRRADDTLLEFMDGLRRHAGRDTPTLARRVPGR